MSQDQTKPSQTFISKQSVGPYARKSPRTQAFVTGVPKMARSVLQSCVQMLARAALETIEFPGGGCSQIPEPKHPNASQAPFPCTSPPLLPNPHILLEGCRENTLCSRDTYPESYITKYTSIRRWYSLPLRVLLEEGVAPKHLKRPREPRLFGGLGFWV